MWDIKLDDGLKKYCCCQYINHIYDVIISCRNVLFNTFSTIIHIADF